MTENSRKKEFFERGSIAIIAKGNVRKIAHILKTGPLLSGKNFRAVKG